MLGLSAEVGNILPFLDNHLVAAPGQGQVDGDPGVIVILGERRPAVAQADTQGHRHLVADIYSLHILQDLKFILPHDRQILFLNRDEILVLLHLLHDSAQGSDILVDLPVPRATSRERRTSSTVSSASS